jgi:hypothetical protein
MLDPIHHILVSGYKGIESVATMWPPMFDPLTNPMASPKPISRIAQVGIITNHGEPLDEDGDYFERKHNLRMSQIVPLEKSYDDRSGKPSLIGNASRLSISGRIIPINKGISEPFNKGGNKPLGGGPP